MVGDCRRVISELFEVFVLIDAGVGASASPRGHLTADQFCSFMTATGHCTLHVSHVRSLVQRVDKDGSGEVEFDEVTTTT